MIETIKGSVQRIVFENPQTGYKVLRVRMPTGPSVSMQGEFGPDMVVGTIADFHGQYKTHVKYGTGFRVSSYDIMHDAEENASIKLFIDLIAPNIGPERADMIVNFFGDDIIDVLDNWPERLTEVEGIGRVSADSLSAAWHENREKWDEMRQEFTLRAFLNALGIKERRVKKILSHFGGGVLAEATIKENPYVLAEIEGFGFSTADFVAKQLGTPEESPQRLRAFIFYSLVVTCPSNGHMYYTQLELAKLLNTYCTEHNTKFIGKDRVMVEDIEPVVRELAEDKKAVVEGEVAYGIRGFNFEARSAELLTEMMETPSDLILINRDYIDEHIKTFERESGLGLSEEQKNALYYFMDKKVFVITGAPGTGKTTVLKAVVSLIKHLRLGLTCLTPTGISAKKMASTIDFEASTIHRAMGFRGNDWVYGESNKFETDVVIVDETSMVDQEVFYRLLAALKNRVHLIFVGDDNQLPSVGCGNVLRELIYSNQVPLVRLEQIFRQNEASDIIKVAHKIKNGDTDLSLFKPDPTADVFFMREKDLARMEQILVKLAQRFKEERRQFQIITPRNEGPLSVSMLNKVLQEILNPPSPDLPQIQCGDYVLRKGDRIRVKKNDYENLIYNGDIGKVVNIGGGFVTIEIDGRQVQLSVEELDEKIKLAYSISVHGCLPKGSAIVTKKGLIPIERVTKNDVVWTHVGRFRQVLWAGSVGEKPRIEIETNTGFVIESSEENPYLVSSNGNYPVFKKAVDIIPGDFICRNTNPAEGVDISIRFRGERGVGRTPRYMLKLPNKVNLDMAWLFGALIGDGCYTDKDDGIVEISDPDNTELLDEFKNIIICYGLNACEHKRKSKRYSVYVSSKNFREFLYRMGLDYVKGPQKTIPEWVFRSKITIRKAVIAGLFDTDGSVDSKGIARYVTETEQVARGLQVLLMSVGIVSFLSKADYYTVSVSGIDLTKFRDVPLRCFKKIDRLKKVKNAKKSMHYSIPYGRYFAELFNTTFKGHEGASQGIKGKGFFSRYKKLYSRLRAVHQGKNRITYPLLWDLEKLAKKERFKLPEDMRKCLRDNYYFDEIISTRSKSPVEMFDFEIEEDHSYVGSTCFCHNSQGHEYQYVILPFINQYGKMLLQRNLLYTAITRAKHKVIVIGHGSALERAINNSSVYRRNTKLGERIYQCLLKRRSASSQPLPEAPPLPPSAQPDREPSLSLEAILTSVGVTN